MRMAYLSLLAGGLAACGDPVEPAPDAALDTSWLREDLVETVAGLAGAPRATVTERSGARAFIGGRLDAVGWPAMQHAYATGVNVHASIPPTTDATRRILIGAHFDSVSRSPGANDNASGTAVVLALARHLRDVPVRNAETLVVLFDQEENGLVGSRAYAAMLTPGTLSVVLTFDQLSWDGDGDRTFEVEMPTTDLEQAYRDAAAVVGATISVTSTEGTDHQSFRERGFAAAGLTEEYVGGDTSPHVHRTTDTSDTVNADYLELAARLAIEVVTQELARP